MSKHPLVLVEWEDAYAEDGGVWDHNSDSPKACIAQQTGWLVFQDADRIALVSGYCDDAMQARFVIPAGMVRSIVMLEPRKSKGRR